MSFRVLDLSYELVQQLRVLHDKLQRHDSDLAKQLRRAGSSIPLNTAEGNGRVGRDRLHSFRIARASTMEVEACLNTAVAWGFFDRKAVSEALRMTRKIAGMHGGLLR